MNASDTTGYRSGFVGIIGRPNVGKSSILNYYLGEKISIVSPRPQTTRYRILGVLTREDAQVMFLDTPGLCSPQRPLERSMVEVAKSVIDEADVLVVVIDGRAGITEDDERVFARLKQALAGGRGGHRPAPPCLLAVNKVDIASKPRLLPVLEACAKTRLFEECVPVSALTGDQMEVLLSCIIARLPEGPRWYEATDRTDQPLSRMIGERVREQILLATRQEVPHVAAVLVDEISEQKRVTVVRATILVERPGQKAILIGRQGLMVKRIGQQARRELERLLGHKVHLELWVKVAADWRSDPRLLRQLGYVT
jgi:GTP-binding protein Era